MNYSQEFEIEVYNSNGEQQPVDYSGNTPDVSCLPVGMYIIRFRQDKDNYTYTIVKNNDALVKNRSSVFPDHITLNCP